MKPGKYPTRLHHVPWLHRRIADRMFRTAEWLERVGTIGRNTSVARRFGAFGKSSAIGFPPGVLFGERFIHIGSGTMIGPYTTMSAGIDPTEDLVLAQAWALRIGDNCSIGRGSSLVSRVGIDVGDNVTTGPAIYVTDHNHRYDDVTLPIKQQWVTEAPVTIGAGSWLGTGVVVLPGAHLGRNVVVGAGSVVRAGVYPDFCVIAGIPARVVKLHDGDGWEAPQK